MKKSALMLLPLLAFVITSFTASPTNFSSRSSVGSKATLQVTWDIGDGGQMKYLEINDTLFVSNARGQGSAYTTVSSPFTQATLFSADDGYVLDTYCVDFNEQGMVLSAVATFEPQL